MHRFFLRLSAALIAAASVATAGFAGEQDLLPGDSLQLSDFQGRTFLESMTAEDGIKSHLDRDFTHAFTVADGETVLRRARGLDPSVEAKVASFFKGGDQGLRSLLDSLAGKATTPKALRPKIMDALQSSGLLESSDKLGLAASCVAPFVALTSGAGTRVALDDGNAFLNFGYAPGSSNQQQLAKDVKSGRSFGVTGKHAALDATDRFYLTELTAYLADESDQAPFYAALLQVLTQSDASGLAALSADGQAVATDFLAVYTAELDRHLMANLGAHPWENDLAEATIVSAYVQASGLMLKKGKLTAGRPEDFFAQGQNGGGIGMTRNDREGLQKALTAAEAQLHPELVAKLKALLGPKAKDDVIHGLMLELNDRSTQASVRANAAELTRTVAELASQLHADAAQLTQILQAQ